MDSIFVNCSMDIRANIPIGLFKNKNIKPIDICLYIIIDQLSYRNGYCWATNKTLANTLNTCEKTIQNSLNTLEKEKFIKRATILKRGIYHRNIYPIREIKEKVIRIEDKKYIELFDYDWLNDN